LNRRRLTHLTRYLISKLRPGKIEGALKSDKLATSTFAGLLAAMQNGVATMCKAGNAKLAAEDARNVLEAGDYPFKSAKQVAGVIDVIIQRSGLSFISNLIRSHHCTA
jgi:hypothetical protein